MDSKFDKVKKELKELIQQGDLLYYSMAHAQGSMSDDFKESLDKEGTKLPNFELEYDSWYSGVI